MASYTGDMETQRGDAGPQVVCVWCSGVIRAAAALVPLPTASQ
jgi:hypothetical protein